MEKEIGPKVLEAMKNNNPVAMMTYITEGVVKQYMEKFSDSLKTMVADAMRSAALEAEAAAAARSGERTNDSTARESIEAEHVKKTQLQDGTEKDIAAALKGKAKTTKKATKDTGGTTASPKAKQAAARKVAAAALPAAVKKPTAAVSAAPKKKQARKPGKKRLTAGKKVPVHTTLCIMFRGRLLSNFISLLRTERTTGGGRRKRSVGCCPGLFPCQSLPLS
jgi:hypothetical protein